MDKGFYTPSHIILLLDEALELLDAGLDDSAREQLQAARAVAVALDARDARLRAEITRGDAERAVLMRALGMAGRRVGDLRFVAFGDEYTDAQISAETRLPLVLEYYLSYLERFR